MCRNIHTLHNFEPPATEDEIRAAAIQYVRKVSGMQKPSRANEAAFERAIGEMERATERLLGALGSWTNPFVSHVLYVPNGVDIAWTPTAPGLGLAASPVTALFGPVVAFNVVALLLPAVSAWTAYLLCRYLTGSLWASVVGGYL